MVAIGTATYFYGINLITRQIPQVKLETSKISVDTELALQQRQFSLLLAGMAGTAIVAGAIAVFVANRAMTQSAMLRQYQMISRISYVQTAILLKLSSLMKMS